MPSRSELPSLLPAAFAALLASFTATPVSAAVLVDCAAGQTITSAIESGEDFIFFNGTCNESISIVRDQISIVGDSTDPDQNVIAGSIRINGAGNATINRSIVQDFVIVENGASARFIEAVLRDGLAVFDSSHARVFDSQITGGSLSVLDASGLSATDTIIDDIRGGVFITNGSMAELNRSPITNTDNGVFVGRNGTLRFRNAFMGPALVDDPNLSCNAICIVDGSVARLDSAVVEGSTEEPGIGGAILASRNGTLLLRGDNSITNTGSQPAVAVLNDSSMRQDLSGAAAASTTTGGAQVDGQSYADIRAAAVSGEVKVRQNSVLRLGSTGFGGDPALTSITGNTTISQASALVVEDPAVTINGTITCLDKQSRLGGTFAGSGAISCKDFNNKKVKR